MRLCERLVELSANTGDFYRIASASLLRCQLQHRFQQSHVCIANCELSGVNSHSDTARARGEIVARESALPALVELAFGGEGEGVRRYDKSLAEFLANLHQNFPS